MARLRRSPALGWERSPLRRPIDRVEAIVVTGLILVFSAAVPVLGVVVGGWIHSAGAGRQHAESAWHQIPATVLTSHGARADSAGPRGTVGMLAAWAAPDGQPRRGWVPVSPSATAGSRVQVWVDRSGSPTGLPLQDAQVQGQEVIAGAAAVCGLGIVGCAAVGTARYLLRRRRLADWDRAWLAVEPQWTQRR